MTKATEKTLQTYRANIKFGKEQKMPLSQGMAIKRLIEEYKIPAIAWGYEGSLIGIETKKQIMIWRDKGTHLEFKGLINKETNSVDLPEEKNKPLPKMKKISLKRYEYMRDVLPPLTLGVKETSSFLRKHDDIRLAKILEYNDVKGAFMQGEGFDRHDIYMITKKNECFKVGKTKNAYNTEIFRYNDWRKMSKKDFDRYNM